MTEIVTESGSLQSGSMPPGSLQPNSLKTVDAIRDSEEWTEKFRPKTLKEIVGNKKALHDMQLWADAWASGMPEKRALIIYGPAGVGKTSSVMALAAERGWEPIELNASDQRTAEAIEKVAGAASRMTSLFSEDGTFSKNNRRLIILDEADNLHGTYDRGGSKAIADVIKKTEHPVILIANDVYGITQGIRGLSEEIPFSAIQTRSIIPAIKKICAAQGIECSDKAAEKIAQNAGGDLRSAVKDLQAAATGKSVLGENDIITSERDVKETIFKALVKVFKGKDRKEALNAIRSLDETPEEVILWVDENLPMQFDDSKSVPGSGSGSNSGFGADNTGNVDNTDNAVVNPDIRNGYEVISRADRYLGRVRRRQNYHLWRYASYIMTVGPMAVRTKEYSGFIKYESPSGWRRAGRSKSMRGMRDSIAMKIASRNRTSMKEARIRSIPAYMKLMRDEETCVELTAKYGFDIDEMIYLLNAKSATKKIQALFERAKALRGPDEEVTVFKEPAQKKKAAKEEPEKKPKEDKKQKTFEELMEEKKKAEEAAKAEAERIAKEEAEKKAKEEAEKKAKEEAEKAKETKGKQRSLFDF